MASQRFAILFALLIILAVVLAGCARPGAAAPVGAQAATTQPATIVHSGASPCTTAASGTPEAASQPLAAGAAAPSPACNRPGVAASPAAGLAGALNAGTANGAAQVAVPGAGSYISVQPSELAAMLKAKNFRLVNVHTPYAGEIPGTDLALPYDQIEKRLGELPSDKTAKILLYCRSGAMSAIAARALVKLGYTNVWNLDGGMSAWEQAGYALVTKK